MKSITLKTPACLGMSILDLSKTLMYDFHQNYMREKYRIEAKLLFTDTISLSYEIEINDVYRDFWVDKDKFDNREYPENSAYFEKSKEEKIKF